MQLHVCVFKFWNPDITKVEHQILFLWHLVYGWICSGTFKCYPKGNLLGCLRIFFVDDNECVQSYSDMGMFETIIKGLPTSKKFEN